jgi:hypothetical protein
MGRPGFWELAAAGVAVGGTAVWAIAVAARLGILRLMLEAFPRSTWDGVTWLLIPALLFMPPVILGLSLPYLPGVRRASAGRSVGASVIGTCLAGAVFGTLVLLVLRYLHGPAVVQLARALSEILVPGFGILVLTGWLLIAGMLLRSRWLRRAAFPVAAAAVLLAYPRVHAHMPTLITTLARPEMNGLFVSVAVGGALGSAWAVYDRQAVVREPEHARVSAVSEDTGP